MEERLEKAPRKKAGSITFQCPNCYKELTRTIWANASEIDEDGELTYDFFEAQAVCRCGAVILAAETDYNGGFEVFWLNEKDMVVERGQSK